MTDTDIKKLTEAEWLRQHTLTKEQTKQLKKKSHRYQKTNNNKT